MTDQAPERVHVSNASGKVEVSGLSEDDVKNAISLYRAVTNERVRAREALAAHVNQAMVEAGISLVSDASQRQLQRSAALRKRLLKENGAATYASLAGLREDKESSVRTWVSRERRRNELFTVKLKGQTLIPSVQLTETGKLNPLIAELVRPLLQAGLDSWSLWAWLTSPAGLLSGEIPAEVAATNMKRAHTAATRYAVELRHSQDATE